MKMLTIAAAVGVALTMGAGNASADPWKDESGHGRWRSDRYDSEPRYEQRAYKEEYRRGRM